jgi:uncharacterized protein (TIGR02594 family)
MLDEIAEPAWLKIARADIGLRELPGAPTEPRIASWLKNLGAWWRDDATPWCGVAVAAWMKDAGQPLPKHWYRAKGWLEWGEPCGPQLGAVVIFERAGGGHVGLAVGFDDHKNAVMVLGGNQGDMVSIRPFDPKRVIAYRYPIGAPAVEGLPFLASATNFSTNEA